MQVINVACGGTLVQDLGAETPHHGPLDSLMVGQRIHLAPASRLARILGKSTVAVRTGNHQAVRDVADIWTFARNTRSSDPNWTLVATTSAS